jgi:hypothetical protein
MTVLGINGRRLIYTGNTNSATARPNPIHLHPSASHPSSRERVQKMLGQIPCYDDAARRIHFADRVFVAFHRDPKVAQSTFDYDPIEYVERLGSTPIDPVGPAKVIVDLNAHGIQLFVDREDLDVHSVPQDQGRPHGGRGFVVRCWCGGGGGGRRHPRP